MTVIVINVVLAANCSKVAAGMANNVNHGQTALPESSLTMIHTVS